jgi:hypothetical protein
MNEMVSQAGDRERVIMQVKVAGGRTKDVILRAATC